MGARAKRYVVDPDDPRAPSQALWDAMRPEERGRILDSLPSDFGLDASPPEGDAHYDAVAVTRDVLRRHFGRTGRRVYVGNNLAVYYPGEQVFAPDVIVVTDVETHARDHWTVSAEGKGVECVIEVLWLGRRRKDLLDNVARYARLGIAEYFIFDRRRLGITGFRLDPHAKTRKKKAYQPIVPQGGRYASRVLGLDLMLEGERLRFYSGFAALPEASEAIARLEGQIDEAVAKRIEAERQADEAERRLAEALAEIERLRRR